jgi:hypothetical protein
MTTVNGLPSHVLLCTSSSYWPLDRAPGHPVRRVARSAAPPGVAGAGTRRRQRCAHSPHHAAPVNGSRTVSVAHPTAHAHRTRRHDALLLDRPTRRRDTAGAAACAGQPLRFGEYPLPRLPSRLWLSSRASPPRCRSTASETRGRRRRGATPQP